jgi:hypothetical protein
MRSTRRISELDHQYKPGFIGKGEVVFDRSNLIGFNKRQLNGLIKRHAPHAMSGNFHSFQVACCAGAKLASDAFEAEAKKAADELVSKCS